ncbi:unnamed protein product [Clonostachys rosea f. rosea IK726]|uniref:Uncharacterized protein n=1 Tax=Clonostachys rosea f. rosea IK726 TaxID=1349383 RepID=A0ACA9UKU7_BIOOC|nr:unnamed protein product [Clonostachys rosea f. rosea IK726]
MDDLSNLDWSAKPTANQARPPPMNPSTAFSSYRASPSPFGGSGRSTPNQGQQAPRPQQNAPPPKPAQDSFSNLMNFGPTKPTQNLSLAERQAQLEAEKRKKEEEKRKQTEAAFGNGQFWDSLGKRGTSASPAAAQPIGAAPVSTDDDDLFAAFSKDTKVDKASHFPPPESQRSTPAAGIDLSNPSAWGAAPKSNGGAPPAAEDDDDPFGLNEFNSSSKKAPQQTAADDDDFLGDLGRPVEEIRQRQQQQQKAAQSKPEPGKPIELDDESSDDESGLMHHHQDARQSRQRQDARPRPKPTSTGLDETLAQLVDYGFSPEDARRGIIESGAGNNVQAVANWLLDDAHRKAKEKATGRSASNGPSQPRRQQSASPAPSSDGDFTKTASAVGNSLFKTANSLWKTGQKKMQQAVADFQQDGGDPNQPRWMREAQLAEARGFRPESDATDEAMMLESGGPPRAARSTSRHSPEPRAMSNSSRGFPTSQPSSSRNSPAPRWQQQPAPPSTFDAKAKLSRLNDDDFSSYSSPNRRRKAAPPKEEKKPEPEPDLLFNTEAPRASQPLPHRPAQSAPPQQPARRPPAQPAPRAQAKSASPAPPRPKRAVPAISPDALQTSTKHRHAGTAHFKRGDYAAAHASYSSSLSTVPSTHPLVIVLLTNRALTALKTGEPKQAVDDADQAIKIIGPGNGAGESVAVKGESGQDEMRDMKELYGKALSRKAEALEQMEKWADAGAVWTLCVEGGVGGPNAIKGRQRCQAAVAPKPKPVAKPAARPRPKPSAAASLAPQKDSEAVTRLREANQAAAKEDDEKFALADKVDAKISAWRDGKRDNLRALLGSLDNVLWEGSGWKKVGMHELVMANKVKIAYMKAIAKTHPDKLPQDANTEVRLIAGLVFSTLNESWDKFKADNGL